MKVCENCEKEFRTFVTIDGKRKNLQRRKYCLDCSPFGQHNTRNFKRYEAPYYINQHGKKVPTEAKKRRDNDKYRRWQKKTRKQRKQKLIDMLGGQCSRCGYHKCTAALQFHHVGEKDFAIGYWLMGKWDRVLKEAKKCELVCANCHAEIHQGSVA